MAKAPPPPPKPLSVEFLRGDEIVLSRDNSLGWFLGSDGVFCEHHDDGATPLRLATRYGSLNATGSASFAEKIMHLQYPEKRKAAWSKIEKAVSQLRDAYRITSQYPTLLGTANLADARFMRITPAILDRHLKGTEKDLQKVNVNDLGRLKQKFIQEQENMKKAQFFEPTDVLSDEEYAAAKAKLLANEGFREIMPFLARERIPVSVLRSEGASIQTHCLL